MADKAEDNFMTAPDYGRSLTGLGINLLVRAIAPALAFQREVLATKVVHETPDFAVLSFDDQQWMLHADHTYAEHPLLALTGDGALRGVGVELRLYGVDPDTAESRARMRGDPVLAASQDKPHGLRECYLLDPDGYVWVPSRALLD